MDTPDVNAADEIAQVAADDVRQLFQRPGLRAIVRLAETVVEERNRSAGERHAS